ncbi:DUF4232 domain-containing protein [Streptomyces sp. NBC_01341]|uniref:DUF4232 domain-containing protein n=1 Tax=Streptomyces sp. NBC_01341 TaxID=2903831 RepID=UPI002E10DDC7|nr:DUF4232 domain-containing protein [Streptomyces sp. NBC_01341]
MPDHARRTVPSFLRSARALSAKKRRAARTVVACTAVALLATAAGCADDGDSGASPTSSAPDSPTVTESPVPSPPATATGTTTPPTESRSASTRPPSGDVAAPDRCTAGQLKPRLGPADVGAGNIRFDLQLINEGKAPCTLRGFPGVSLLRGDGSTIGVPATREGSQGTAVKLGPGESAHATLRTLNKDIKGPDCWPAPTLLKVYPPGLKESLTLRSSTPVVCGDTFTVTALRSQ